MDKRRTVFRKESGYVPFTPNEYFEEALAMAEELGALPVVTGDVMDVNCIGNREEFARIVAGKDMMFTPGSHEFAAFCRAPVEGHEERYAKTRPEVEAAFPQFNFTFESRAVGGVNIITVDNSRDFFPAEALDALKAEAEKGLPMILFMHDPLVDHGLLRVREPNPFTLQPQEVYEASDEVVKFIDKHYRTKANKKSRAIAGLSMGGFHSLHISKQYPDMFNYVGLFSAAIMPGKNATSPVYENMEGKLATQFAKKPALYWIAIGKTDFLYKANVEYRKLLDEKGYPYEYFENEDGHIWRNWRIYLSEFAPKLFK
jgi:pimeloyl-ACP methyl ester carboxylesterase